MNVLSSSPVQISQITEGTELILDYLFQKSAIILNDTLSILNGGAVSIAGININLPIPLIGFEYQKPSEIELLKYSYSDYPYVNKQTITNAYMKESTRLSIIGLRPITHKGGFATSVVGNYLTNEVLLSTLQLYCDHGGTFTVLTMWGQINNLVLEKLSGVDIGGNNSFQGQGYLFEFKRVNFPKEKFSAVKSVLNKITLGVL